MGLGCGGAGGAPYVGVGFGKGADGDGLNGCGDDGGWKGCCGLL